MMAKMGYFVTYWNYV